MLYCKCINLEVSAMSKSYSAPKIEIRKYRVSQNVFTDSDPGLDRGDDYGLDAAGTPIEDALAD